MYYHKLVQGVPSNYLKIKLAFNIHVTIAKLYLEMDELCCFLTFYNIPKARILQYKIWYFNEEVRWQLQQCYSFKFFVLQQ